MQSLFFYEKSDKSYGRKEKGIAVAKREREETKICNAHHTGVEITRQTCDCSASIDSIGLVDCEHIASFAAKIINSCINLCICV